MFYIQERGDEKQGGKRAPRHKSPALANKVARRDAFGRSQIYWYSVFRNFLPIRERLCLPYGDKRDPERKFRA